MLAGVLVSHHEVDLSRHNDETDACEHPVDHRGSEKAGELAGFQETQDDLYATGHDADGEREPVAGREVSPAKFGDRPENDYDHTRRRTVDGHVRTAQQRGQHPGDDAGDNARYRRHPRSDRDAEAKRESDQEYDEPRNRVALPVLGQPRQKVLRRLRTIRLRRVH